MPDTAGSTGSASSAGSPGTPQDRPTVERGDLLFGEIRDWLLRFICTMDDSDLDLLVLWAAHTHLCIETYTTPRLILDSPVPGSGKTTTLDHLERLCLHPVQMASLSSPALLTRMLDAGMRTILIDEADRSLNEKMDGVPELLAVLNSGYKRGGTRPVLVPGKEGKWTVSEMSTYSPVAMAGNNPNLPDDTRSRSIRVLLMPANIEDKVEDSDWEMNDQPARELGARLAAWAERVRDQVRSERPPLPDVVTGRARERWFPLMRVATAAGGRWPAVVADLAVRDVERVTLEREEGIVQQRPAVALIHHTAAVWPDDQSFVATEVLIRSLTTTHPDIWGSDSAFGKALTPQRLGRMLVSSYNIHSSRLGGVGARGYTRLSFEQAWRRMGVRKTVRP